MFEKVGQEPKPIELTSGIILANYEKELIWCSHTSSYNISYHIMYSHIKMIRCYDKFPPELRDPKPVLPIATIEVIIKVIILFMEKEATQEQNDCIESTIEVMEDIRYESPTQSEVEVEVEVEFLRTREEEERKYIPQWTIDVLGRSQEVQQFLLAIASCPMFHIEFKYQEMQDGPTHQKMSVPCMCPFGKHV